MDNVKYIDREALIRYAEKQEVIIKDGTSIADAMRIQGNVFRRCVETVPAVDVVEVVRCKECKHMIPQSHTRYCTVWHGVNGMGDGGFCSYGERKDV